MARRIVIPSRSVLLLATLVALAGLLVAGCGAPHGDARARVAPASAPAAPRGPAPIHLSADPWILATERWEATYRGPYLGNGALGAMLGASGASRLPQGWQPAYAAGLYRREALFPLPPLFPVELRAEGRVFGTEPDRLKRYRQELRLREGLLVTRAVWDPGAGEVEVELEAAFLRHRPDTALLVGRIANRGRSELLFGVPTDAWPGARAEGEGRLRWPEGRSAEGIACEGTLRLLEGAPLPAAPEMALGYRIAPGGSARFSFVARVAGLPTTASSAPDESPEAALAAHRAAWSRLWERDIEIEGDPEAQQLVRACMFQLLCSLRAGSDGGVPPMGLSSGAFNGHVFWDSESWMLPALLPQFPELARAILDYRFRTLDGARANARAEGLPGASYAWESAATGRETLRHEIFRHGRHVSGDIALAIRQYVAATGDVAWLRERGWPILQATAENWAARAQPDGRGGFVIRGVTTPDEHAGRVDHSAWTHHVAAVNLRFAAETARRLGRRAPARWEGVAAGLRFLRDPSGLILAYAGFTERTRAKQADALLIAHPGEAKLDAAELGRLYDFYAPRVIPNGPAMTDAIHAIVAARLGRDAEALERFRASYRPFVRPPFHVFSEKRSRDNLCFLTGAGGVVQAVLYGFGGLRLEPDPARPELPRLEPRLPAGWQALRVRGLRWRGAAWDLELRPGSAPRWTRHAETQAPRTLSMAQVTPEP